MYSVKVTGKRFRSFEADHKKAYQELLEKKTFRTVVIYFAIKQYVFYRYIRCYVLPVINFRRLSVCIYVHIRACGWVRQIERAGKSVLCRQKFTQEFRFKTHLFLQNVLQRYASNIY
jgi:hypothetical protein